ncbi:hypothetical protein [Corynebacterium ammoniagenes]|uniref:Uncharacterized protein n=1 Tax=Corynebacterium ammoniagenes DSM 20306 TaxID=649754 RepID=A0ABN0AE16_CORAM|nr:hypothetical protein [Corynebacterium ammoniagenes]APT81876.1 hypothetical protein CAMM_02710 [Corynebacterium ammoniagenes DSM 20306]AQS72992.1 hypothetical protein CA40472_03035 [Corynebacterium ammoniagenes]EFG80961.1 hypothetical protein HMPREF0281_01835 [Corynebacterium ammoniagenes DSM 20306]NMF32685.1 hypothetical protein [Corynebacterium ammoniagenes]
MNKVEKEIQAWEKLQRKLVNAERKPRPLKARARAIRGFWCAIYELNGVEVDEKVSLDQEPVNPYRADPLTGALRGIESPEDELEKILYRK